MPGKITIRPGMCAALCMLLLTGVSAYGQSPPPPPPPLSRVIFPKPVKVAADSLFSRQLLGNMVSNNLETGFYQFSVKAPGAKPMNVFGRDSLVFYVKGRAYREGESGQIDTSFLHNGTTKYGWGRAMDYQFADSTIRGDRTVIWYGEPPPYSQRYLEVQRLKKQFVNKTVAGVVTGYTYNARSKTVIDGFTFETGTVTFRVFIRVDEAKRLVKNLFPGDVVLINTEGIYNWSDTEGLRLSPNTLIKDGETLVFNGTVQI
ncbi:hypothetical protein [Hufsiella ginkgonis]|uniref:Uncharacterized protein n=1 Tax=Hufsiella ginkgonis TaxID=2695274 RepID=A0A7K1XVR3_9SPHI|nr:hypothetical protein [Hufsiella ginkgonis]MXV14606.1 hypothetical protein [Hufsiella ginkgonis]